MKPNKLITEKSPYLLQHAYNPVDWYPWGEEAFEIASKLQKPIFLSVGYSSCHWCHVMEKESFNDPETANILNEVFVCIKVDREERPDIDSFYMKVCQMMTGSGGWPLTIIMTPDKKPFFAGTYFPRESTNRRIGLKDLALNVQNVWSNRKSDVESSANNLLNYIRENEVHGSTSQFSEGYFDEAFRSLEFAFDKVYGGFGGAPKFPTPQNFLFLLEYYALKKKSYAYEMVEKTLSKMRLGGIFDQIGFGYHRYSTDSRWMVPHFEKMLYDQAMLLLAYAQAYKISKNSFFLEVADEIVDYVFRELLYKNKAFYSSEDADSEGLEGKFYLYDFKELKQLIQSDFDLFQKIYNVNPLGNFEDPFGHIMNQNILHLNKDLEEIASEEGISLNILKEKITNWRKILFDYREKRVRPFKDQKLLTDWNGLMIAALANYFFISKRNDVLVVLRNYYNFFKERLLKKDGTIYHVFVENEGRIDGFLNDYAFSIFGFYEMFLNTKDYDSLSLAYKLLNKAIELFWDNESGAFLLSYRHNRDLIINPKEFFDGAIPSGNSAMFYVLHQFFLVTADESYNRILYSLENSFANLCDNNPLSYNFFNYSFIKKIFQNLTIVITYDDEKDTEYKKYLEFFEKVSIHDIFLVFFNPSKHLNCEFVFWKDYSVRNGKTTAYLCNNFACYEPITNFDLFVKEFNKMINGT